MHQGLQHLRSGVAHADLLLLGRQDDLVGAIALVAFQQEEHQNTTQNTRVKPRRSEGVRNADLKSCLEIIGAHHVLLTQTRGQVIYHRIE